MCPEWPWVHPRLSDCIHWPGAEVKNVCSAVELPQSAALSLCLAVADYGRGGSELQEAVRQTGQQIVSLEILKRSVAWLTVPECGQILRCCGVLSDELQEAVRQTGQQIVSLEILKGSVAWLTVPECGQILRCCGVLSDVSQWLESIWSCGSQRWAGLSVSILREIRPLLGNLGRLQCFVHAVSKLNVITKWKLFCSAVHVCRKTEWRVAPDTPLCLNTNQISIAPRMFCTEHVCGAGLECNNAV
jgi:hypothetical protein